jgi:hypothetical protein
LARRTGAIELSSSQWPTITAGSATKGADQIRRDTGNPNSDLPTMIQNWPTPQVADVNMDRGSQEYAAEKLANSPYPNLAVAAKCWPTPPARDWKDTGDMTNVPENALLGRAVLNWTTPSASDGERGGTITEAMSGTSLTQQVKSIWSTPRSSDGEKGGPNQSFGAGGIPLPAQAAQWMTPRVSESGQYQYNKGNPDDPILTLQGQSQAWSTPSVADTTGSRMTRSGDRSNELLLKGQAANLASSLPDHPISTVGEESSKIRRTLNPLFVEWLMGWPRGWTCLALTPHALNGCACSATELSAFKQRMRTALLSLGLPPEAQEALAGSRRRAA